MIQTGTTIIDQSTNVTNNTNNIQINVFGSTASALTPEIIAQKVMEVISLEAVEKGLAHMTQEVARPVFSNEKGNWLVRVADASRSKLIVRTDEGDQPDHQGRNTTRLLKKPFMEASLIALEETDRPRDVENTIEAIRDDDTYDKQTMGALLGVAPTTFDQTNPLIFTEAHRIAEEKTRAKLDRVMAKRKRLQEKQKALEADKVSTTSWTRLKTYMTAPSGIPFITMSSSPTTSMSFSLLAVVRSDPTPRFCLLRMT